MQWWNDTPTKREINVVKMKVLTQRTKEGSHHETELTVDWEGITEEQLKCLALNAIIHDFQCRTVKSPLPIPEKVYVLAREQVHKPSPSVMKWTPQPKTIKISKDLDTALSMLSDREREELRALLSRE